MDPLKNPSKPQRAPPVTGRSASTTAALVMGDALAIALLEARGFTSEDFARSHPAGSLGRRLAAPEGCRPRHADRRNGNRRGPPGRGCLASHHADLRRVPTEASRLNAKPRRAGGQQRGLELERRPARPARLRG